MITSLILYDDYHAQTNQTVIECSAYHRSLNTSKTKELIVNLKMAAFLLPLNSCVNRMWTHLYHKIVQIFRNPYQQKPRMERNTDHMNRKAQQRLYHPQKLKNLVRVRFNLLLSLSTAIFIFFSPLSRTHSLNNEMTTGSPQLSLNYFTASGHCWVGKVTLVPTLPVHYAFQCLNTGRRYRTIASKETH